MSSKKVAGASSSKVSGMRREQDAPATLTPKLRFPEFQDAAAWSLYILEELEGLGWVELGRGDVISNQDIKAIPGNYPIYSSSVKNNGLMGSYGRFIFDEELISWSVDGGGDFFHRPSHKFSVTNVSGYMRLDTSHLNYRFTASQLQALHASLTFDYQFKAHPSVIRKLYRLAIPSVNEQQKIAECLTTLDEVIAAQSQKLDALKTHKKGLMQQLFPRAGETLPRLRFPEFQAAPEWEAKLLGQVIEIASGQVDPKQPPYCDSPQIGSENIESHSGKLVNVKSAGDKGVISGNYAFDENDILYSKIRPALNKVAAPAFKGICSADIYPIRPANGGLLRGYLLYLLLSQEFLDYAIRNSERGKIPKINRDGLLTYTTLIPSPAEQQRIATCLTTLDDLITAQSAKLSALKTHKKGLMQQLFPSPGEVGA